MQRSVKRCNLDHLSAWQRKWRMATHRVVILLHVDRVKAELKRKGYPASYLGEERVDVFEMIHGFKRKASALDADDAALTQLTAQISKTTVSSASMAAPIATATKITAGSNSNSVLSQAGNELMASASTPQIN